MRGKGVVCLVGVIDVGERLQQGLVVLEERGFQARVGGVNVCLDAAVGVERHLQAGAEQAYQAFLGVVAVDVEHAVAEEVEGEARVEVGFGARQFGGVGVDLRGAGAQVGAALYQALRGLAGGRCGRVVQRVGSACGQLVALRGFAQQHGDFADLRGAFGFEGAARGTGGGQVALCFCFFVSGGVPGAVAGIHVMREFFEGGDVGAGEALPRFEGARLQVGVGDGGGDL